MKKIKSFVPPKYKNYLKYFFNEMLIKSEYEKYYLLSQTPSPSKKEK